MQVILHVEGSERLPPGFTGELVTWIAKTLGRSDLPPEKRPKTAISDIRVTEA